ncbi:hypothetical protein HDR59_03755 [bacterium]|nr:hypothetical protein [bacterium]
MKQNLMNSLMILSEAVDELNRVFSLYKNVKREEASIQTDDFKAIQSKLQSEIDALKQSLMFERDKIARANEEIKSLSVELKNNL